MNYLVLQLVMMPVGPNRLEHEEFPVCRNHLKPEIHQIIGMSKDTCRHCDAQFSQQWQDLLGHNPWIQDIKENEVVYISGPMSGLPDLNRPAFRLMAHALKLRGAIVINPADNPPDWSYAQNMKYDLQMLQSADHIVMLKKWDKSRGAKIEFDVAQTFEITTHYEK